MANALTRTFSGKGYVNLASACGDAKKWAEEHSLGHSTEELKFSVRVSVSEPTEGQARLFEPDKFDSNAVITAPKQKRSKRKKNA